MFDQLWQRRRKYSGLGMLVWIGFVGALSLHPGAGDMFGHAFANEPGPNRSVANTGEVLFVYPPDGWRLAFQTQISNIRSFEYVPENQSTTDWSEMITVQIVKNTRDTSPAEIARALRARFAADCGKIKHRGPESMKINGLLAARLYVECSDPVKERQPSGAKYLAHEVAAIQIVQGKADLYVIERAWHGGRRESSSAPYGRADVWGWDSFFHEIEICDSTTTNKSCFGLGLLSPEKADIFVSQIDPVLPYGCDYFRMLTLMPDLSRPTLPTVVMPIKIGLGRFGDSKTEVHFVEALLSAYAENRPTAVILTLKRSALASNYRADTAQTLRHLAAMKKLLSENGVNNERMIETINTRCPQP